MRHARADYNRIQDPGLYDPSLLGKNSSPIAEDEPVFLIRAQDAAAPATLRRWAEYQPFGSKAAQLALAWAGEMEYWQKVNRRKIADLPDE